MTRPADLPKFRNSRMEPASGRSSIRYWRGLFRWVVVAFLAGLPALRVSGQDELIDPPIRYHETRGDNPVIDLFDRVRSGETKLRFDRNHGHLKSILSELQIPVSSQVMVFSKTSLQAGRISPRNPRAIYFNDEVFVGWVRGSPLLEIATADPKLGAVFYTVRMYSDRPILRRENNACLACHEKTLTGGRIPEHIVRSVMTRRSGKINLLLDEYETDHSSPFEQRWGGWYVTGRHGHIHHLGNSFLEDEQMVRQGEPNREHLDDFIETSGWLSPHSDIVALMVMEHQKEMLNRLTHASFSVRRAEYARSQDGSDDDDKAAEFDSVVEKAAGRIVEYMLFDEEAFMDAPIQGVSDFATEFSQAGPFDSRGRSLRQFDLTSRMFRYPCSYLIYSPMFDQLPSALKQRVYRRLWETLTATPPDGETSASAGLNRSDRQAILQILRETKTDLPEYWSPATP
jgi:hypothetical protein